MKHIIVAHRYEHATWFITNVLKVPRSETFIIIERIYALMGLHNYKVWILNAPRTTLTQRELDNRRRATEILAGQKHRIEIEEYTLP